MMEDKIDLDYECVDSFKLECKASWSGSEYYVDCTMYDDNLHTIIHMFTKHATVDDALNRLTYLEMAFHRVISWEINLDEVKRKALNNGKEIFIK